MHKHLSYLVYIAGAHSDNDIARLRVVCNECSYLLKAAEVVSLLSRLFLLYLGNELARAAYISAMMRTSASLNAFANSSKSAIVLV